MSGAAPSPQPPPARGGGGSKTSILPLPLREGAGGRGRRIMSNSAAHFLLETRGTQRDLDAFVVAACFDRAGTTLAIALGDGTLRLVEIADRETWRTAEAHDGAILSLAPDAVPAGFITGGDDGKFRRVTASGTASTIADFRSKWVEHVASHPGDKGKGLLACTIGKIIHLFDHYREKLKELAAPVLGHRLAFDARGKRVGGSALQRRLAVVRRGQGGQPAQAGMEGQPHRDRHSSGRRRRGDRDAGERAARLAPVRQPAPAHERLSREDRVRCRSPRNGKWLATSGADAMVLGRSSAAARWARRRSNWPAATVSPARASRHIRSRRWWRAALPTDWWCWRR